MATPIDSSRPYRFTSELEDLVRAVMRADPHHESTWIEWKSRLDLEEWSAYHHIAKHVLGFANRTVEIARAHADGFAYLIIGADPEGLLGISPVDPATFQPRIERYVGPGVRWHAEYLHVQDKQVLVVIVEPPRAGDPIYPLRRQFTTSKGAHHHAGQIFVRRLGATAPANDFEIDQLTERVRSNNGLDINVLPLVESIEQRPSEPDIKRRAAAERAATLARPRYGERVPGGLLRPPPSFRLPLGLDVKPDDRSEEDYEKQVDRYIEHYERALQARTHWLSANHLPTTLRLDVINQTEDNFADMELKVHVPGDVFRWPEEPAPPLDLPDLPARPNVLGTPQKRFSEFPRFPLVSPRPFNAPSQRKQTFTVQETGSVTITFSGLHVRPQKRLSLDPVRLLVNADVPSVLNCTWTATARNARGQCGGTFDLSVVGTTLDFRDLGARDPGDA